MATTRLSALQRRVLTWLLAHDQRVQTSLKGLEAKGLVTIARTPGGHAEAVDLTAEGRMLAMRVTGSCE